MTVLRIDIPELETERLILRAPLAEDYPGFAEFYASERSQHVGGPLPPRQSWRHFATLIGHWALRGFGMWSVTLRETGASVGMVGLWYPIDWPEQEIGWVLSEAAEGKGIGFEAASAARDHAFGTLGWDTAVSYIAPENTRSIALAERLGARRDETAQGLAHVECHVYRPPRPAQGAA